MRERQSDFSRRFSRRFLSFSLRSFLVGMARAGFFSLSRPLAIWDHHLTFSPLGEARELANHLLPGLGTIRPPESCWRLYFCSTPMAMVLRVARAEGVGRADPRRSAMLARVNRNQEVSDRRSVSMSAISGGRSSVIASHRMSQSTVS